MCRREGRGVAIADVVGELAGVVAAGGDQIRAEVWHAECDFEEVDLQAGQVRRPHHLPIAVASGGVG